MKKYKVIYNPSSGKKTEQEKIFKIGKKLLEQEAVEICFYATKRAGDAQIETIRACEDGYDAILGCGGDGTLHEIVNGMMAFQGEKPPLAILPAGTVNDFAKHLKIPTRVDKFVDMVIRGNTEAVDVGKVDQDFFINVVAGGAFANIPHEVPSDSKTVLGKYAYYLQGAFELGEQLEKSYQLKIHADGETFEMEAMMFIVTNTSSVGGFTKLAPAASYVDGYLDLLVIEKAPPTELVSIAQKLIWGEHLTHKMVHYSQAKSIVIESDVPICIDIDGEEAHVTEMKFSLENRAIRLLVP